MSRNEKKTPGLDTYFTDSEKRLQAQCAINLILSKLQIIDSELSLAECHRVIVNLQSRIKTLESVKQKLRKKRLPQTYKAVEENINDLVGVRAVCAFEDDIYRVADSFRSHPDIKLVKKKDYIKTPKKSGYRSLHLIVQVPVYFSSGAKWTKVELQLRTSAMNFWADLDHQLRYKKGAKEAELIGRELKDYAGKIRELDENMVKMRKRIEAI